MAKYHINPDTGNPGLCKAAGDNCPFGGDDAHYDSPEGARAAYEEKMAQQSNLPPVATSDKLKISDLVRQSLASGWDIDFALNTSINFDAATKTIKVEPMDVPLDRSEVITWDQAEGRGVPASAEAVERSWRAVGNLKRSSADGLKMGLASMREVRELDNPQLYDELARELIEEVGAQNFSTTVQELARTVCRANLVKLGQLDKTSPTEVFIQRASDILGQTNQTSRRSLTSLEDHVKETLKIAPQFHYSKYQLRTGERDFEKIYIGKDRNVVAGLGDRVTARPKFLGTVEGNYEIKRIVEMANGEPIIWLGRRVGNYSEWQLSTDPRALRLV